MKKIVILAFVFLACKSSFLFAQDSIVYRTESLKEINLRFELPETWSKPSISKTKNESQIYSYTRDLLELNKKKTKASLSVLVEKVKPSTSIKDYSLKTMGFFQKQKSFQIKKTFTASDGRFSLPYTIGYEAEYLDGNDVKHHLYILHTIEFNHAAQLLIDFPYEDHEYYEEEQINIIKSLRYERF